MFAYRHGFHAGNRADVFKHSVLTAALLRFRAKEKPFVYFESHAGAGRYKLDSEWMLQTGEASEGIGALLSCDERRNRHNGESETGSVSCSEPTAVASYKRICAQLYGKRIYPGSPEIAACFSRPGDSLVLCELHPTEIEVLRRNMKKEIWTLNPELAVASQHGAIHMHYRDGFEALTALLPPGKQLPKRGLALVDPSYELSQDYGKVAEILPASVERWNTGVFIVWYPLVERRRRQIEMMKRKLADKLSALFSSARQVQPAIFGDGDEARFFFSEMEFPGNDADGMHGCGILVVRPQWGFAREVDEIKSYLAVAMRR